MPSDADQIRDLEEELDALEDPTTAEVLLHTRDYDAGIVAAIGVQRGTTGGEGGSQPFDTVEVTPGPEQLYGLLISALAGFQDVFNAYIRVLRADDSEAFNMDDGGFDMWALNGQQVHISMRSFDSSSRAELNSETGILISTPAMTIKLGQGEGFQISAAVPSNSVPAGSVQLYYDDTIGAPKVLLRGKDNNGDPFDAEIPLT